jgi:hypothetical protein
VFGFLALIPRLACNEAGPTVVNCSVCVSNTGNPEIVEFLAGEMQGTGAAKECYMVTELCRYLHGRRFSCWRYSVTHRSTHKRWNILDFLTTTKMPSLA